MLESYTTLRGNDLKLPSFLEVDKEVTKDAEFSMFNLSRKHENHVIDSGSYSYGIVNGDVQTKEERLKERQLDEECDRQNERVF